MADRNTPLDSSSHPTPGTEPSSVGRRTAPQLDAAAVKAFAHPLRVRLYYLLDADGPATASGLAVKVGESSGSTSYHLRQMARHGVIVDIPERGTAKERWWQTNPAGFSVAGTQLRADPGLAAAVDLLLSEFGRQRVDELRTWTDEALTAPAAWVEASTDHRRAMVLTASEMHRLGGEIRAVADRYRLSSSARELIGTRDADGEEYARVLMHLDVFPVGVGGREERAREKDSRD